MPPTMDNPAFAPVSDFQVFLNAGVSLTRWVLVILAASLGFALYASMQSETRHDTSLTTWTARVDSNATDTARMRLRLEALQHVETQVAAAREHTLKVMQLVLLNVLLPVLTALLGYVFGSTKPEQAKDKPA